MNKCSECGYTCLPDEYHPYEYCVLVKAGIEPREFIQREIKRINSFKPTAYDADLPPE